MREIINILEGLQETRLRLLELVPKLLNQEGQIDEKKVAFYAQELEDAIQEARHYADVNTELIRWLRRGLL